MDNGLKAYVLAGATCTGKSAVAQVLAERNGRDIVSADSMLVYVGMDIGTAKPDAEARRRVRTWLVDAVEPSQMYSVGAYRKDALAALRQIGAEGREAIVVGGSGLYLKALMSGLSEKPAGQPSFRRRCEDLLRDQGIEALQRALKDKAPQMWRDLNDQGNPRRLIRALEVAEFGAAGPSARSWDDCRRLHPIPGLRYAVEALNARIAERVDAMYRLGLIDEVSGLLMEFPVLSATARHAIGYAEVMDVLEGRCSESEAKARTVVRTRQLAKRQRTWFRTQMNVFWIDVDEGLVTDDVADRVAEAWLRLGPAPIVEVTGPTEGATQASMEDRQA